MENKNIKDKVALVTGATGAIGTSISKKLSDLGAKVIITGTKSEKVKALSKSLSNGTLGVTANLSDGKDIKKLFDESIKKFKKIDILINNAGINRDSLSIRMSQDQWDEVIQLNLNSTFQLSQLVVKSMIKERWGRIIGISSIIGLGGNIGQSNYAASKAGMIGMHKSLALESASRGITVNCIAPGFIKSPMTEAIPEDQKNILLKKIPVGKIGKPEDIANCVEFLTSENASFITGSTININGGMLMI